VNTQNDSLASLDIELKRLQVRREQLALDDELASRARTAKVVEVAQAGGVVAVKATKTFAKIVFTVLFVFFAMWALTIGHDPDHLNGSFLSRVTYYVYFGVALWMTPIALLIGYGVSRPHKTRIGKAAESFGAAAVNKLAGRK
jgi:hypothetical protein